MGLRVVEGVSISIIILKAFIMEHFKHGKLERMEQCTPRYPAPSMADLSHLSGTP